MYRIVLVLIIFYSKLTFGQNSERVYALTIAGHQPGDTLQKAVLRANPYIAESIDDFGFEILLRGKNIKHYSVNLYVDDSILFSETKVIGFNFPKELLAQVKSTNRLLRLEISNLFIKHIGKPVRIVKGPIVFYLR